MGSRRLVPILSNSFTGGDLDAVLSKPKGITEERFAEWRPPMYRLPYSLAGPTPRSEEFIWDCYLPPEYQNLSIKKKLSCFTLIDLNSPKFLFEAVDPTLSGEEAIKWALKEYGGITLGVNTLNGYSGISFWNENQIDFFPFSHPSREFLKHNGSYVLKGFGPLHEMPFNPDIYGYKVTIDDFFIEIHK